MTTTEKAIEALRASTEIMARMYGAQAEDAPQIVANRAALASLEAERAAPAPARELSDTDLEAIHDAWLQTAEDNIALMRRALAAAGHAPQPLTGHALETLCEQMSIEPYQVRAVEQALGIRATKGDSDEG